MHKTDFLGMSALEYVLQIILTGLENKTNISLTRADE